MLDDTAVFRRMERSALALSIVGGVVIGVAVSWRHGGGFLAGAALSSMSLYATHRYVRAVTGDMPKGRRGWVVAIRYIVMAATLYAILKFLRLDPGAALAGLFVAAAAAILEILFELIRAWKHTK